MASASSYGFLSLKHSVFAKVFWVVDEGPNPKTLNPKPLTLSPKP